MKIITRVVNLPISVEVEVSGSLHFVLGVHQDEMIINSIHCFTICARVHLFNANRK